MDPVVIVLTTVGWLISTLINKGITALLEEWAKHVGLGKEFITLKMELMKINATLETARGLQKINGALLDMLKHLRQLAYDADDLLDELDYYRIKDDVQLRNKALDSSIRRSSSQITGPSGSSSSSSSGFKLAISRVIRQRWCSSSGDVVEQTHSTFPHKITMSRRINKLITKLKDSGDAVHNALMLKATIMNSTNFTNHEVIESNPRETTSRMIERVFGRDKEQDNLINLMTGEESASQNLLVIAIVGHGGIGKTTLARLVYNDPRVKTHFELRMWVTVSLNFDKRRLTQEILESASGSGTSIRNLDTLQTTLEKILETKRFLLILDDLWEDEKINDWKLLLAPLKNNSKKGNVVLLTTRKPGIKKLDSTINFLNLDGLEEKDYWSLFKLHAFGHEMHEGNINLQNIGRDIVRKLKENPLAAKTVGALLKNDLGERHWRTVLESEEWKHDDGVNSIMAALRISYEYLPFHLQRCLTYCALFPKDFEFQQEFLVNLWIAQSFIQAENKRLEYVGKKNLEYLVDFGFLQRNDKEDDHLDDFGFLERNNEKNEEPVYVMHDLLHDLAQNIASEECLSNLDGGEIQEILSTTRHLSIGPSLKSGTEYEISISGDLEKILIKVGNQLKAGKLSTLIIVGGENIQRIEGFPKRLKNTKSLRVLVLQNISKAPTLFSISIKFTHLRYLYLCSDNKTLPREICRLYHLQFLNVRDCYDLEDLPIKFSNLINLRHFIVSDDNQNLHSLIAGVGKLANLRQLHKFRVRKEKEYVIEQLRGLKELGGQLLISNLENSTVKARGAGLIEKYFLDRLHLSWDRENSDVGHPADADVLEGLQPHPNLKEIKITKYGGGTSATWFNSLTCLEEVDLKACVAWEILPPLGQLPLLKILYLTSMSAVREIGPDLYGCGQYLPFQCLEVMILRDLPKLTKWVWDDRCQRLPILRKFLIYNCPELELPFPSCVSPADFNEWFPKLEKLKIIDCPKIVQLSPLPSNEKVTVHLQNVGTFENFELSASRLDICKPSNPKAWDEVSYHNLRTRTITELDLRSVPYPLSWDNLLNLACLEKLRINDSSVTFSLPNNEPYNQECHSLMFLNLLSINKSDITGKQLTNLGTVSRAGAL